MNDPLTILANTSPRRAIAVARANGLTSFRFARALARLDERMEEQSFRQRADTPGLVALYERFNAAAGIVEDRREMRFDTRAAGAALRRLHKLQAKHRAMLDALDEAGKVTPC